jgi:hypothetical protein
VHVIGRAAAVPTAPRARRDRRSTKLLLPPPPPLLLLLPRACAGSTTTHAAAELVLRRRVSIHVGQPRRELRVSGGDFVLLYPALPPRTRAQLSGDGANGPSSSPPLPTPPRAR